MAYHMEVILQQAILLLNDATISQEEEDNKVDAGGEKNLGVAYILEQEYLL